MVSFVNPPLKLTQKTPQQKSKNMAPAQCQLVNENPGICFDRVLRGVFGVSNYHGRF